MGTSRTVFYENPDEKNQVVKFSVDDLGVVSHSKNDSFGRKDFDELQFKSGFVSREFEYLKGEATEAHLENDSLKSVPTTQLVSKIVFSTGRTISYEYDNEERITKVIDSVDGITEYTYDALGQLLTEKKNNETVNSMLYDNYGNILQKNGVQYEYDSVWKDKLIKVGNKTITYDEQGNPTNYLGKTAVWEKGRQLKSFGDISFEYNANGIRTSKTVEGVKHSYILDGTKILLQSWNDNILETLYDNEDSVCGIVYNSVPYFFHKNLQGDIIAIADTEGKIVARYSYDAWGNATVTYSAPNGSIATINPYRYRGYYFDPETNLYYLQSRYYDPTTGRFRNADDTIIACLMINIIGHNLFGYCYNEPVLIIDYFGYAPKGSEIPPDSSGYVPPKGGPRKGKTKAGKTGWVDKNGNVWVPDPSNHGGDHWDVTGKDGYINVGRNGHAWGGKGKVSLPKSSKSKIEIGKIICGVVVVVLAVLAYLAVKVIAAYFTGGASLVFI